MCLERKNNSHPRLFFSYADMALLEEITAKWVIVHINSFFATHSLLEMAISDNSPV